MNQLIIIEGIPGSGKTTLAQKMAEGLGTIAEDVHLYVEGDLHPADMAWCACLTQKEYKEVCSKYPQYEEEFEKNKSVWHEYVILAYTKVTNLSEALFQYFEGKELYDGHGSCEMFCEIHEDRWQKFGQEATGINIFECALLQNQVNELMLFRDADEKMITAHIQKLITAVQRLKPIIIYLEGNTKEVLERVAKERIDAEGNRVWESRVAAYISESPYGRKLGLKGITDMQLYFERRKKIELDIIKEIDALKYIVPVALYHQEEITKQIVNKIVELLKQE